MKRFTVRTIPPRHGCQPRVAVLEHFLDQRLLKLLVFACATAATAVRGGGRTGGAVGREDLPTMKDKLQVIEAAEGVGR